MNCLITGGAGHIGSHLALRLHEEGHEVDIVDDLSVGTINVKQDLRNQGWEGEFIEANIKDPKMTAHTLQLKKYDICFHLAGYTVPQDSVEKPVVYYENNLSPFTQFLSSLVFHGVNRIVLCRSEHNYTPWETSAKTMEQILYDVCKVTPTINYSSFILPEVVGNHINGKIGDYGFNKKNKLICNCMSASAKNIPQVVVDNGANVHKLIHVDDVVEELIKSLNDTKNQVHCVNPAIITNARNIVESCVKVTAGKYPIIEKTYDQNEVDTVDIKVNKNATITCLDTITKSTWNWIKIVRKIP